MTRSRKVMPPPPKEPMKMLYEYEYDELPPEKKFIVKAMLKIYLDWVISQPKFWSDEVDSQVKTWIGIK